MGKSDIDAKVQKIVKAAEEKIRAQHETHIQRELKVVEERARKYFEGQEEPDVSLFLGDGRKARGRGPSSTAKVRECSVCHLEHARNTFTGAKKKEHSRAEHEAARAAKAT